MALPDYPAFPNGQINPLVLDERLDVLLQRLRLPLVNGAPDPRAINGYWLERIVNLRGDPVEMAQLYGGAVGPSEGVTSPAAEARDDLPPVPGTGDLYRDLEASGEWKVWLRSENSAMQTVFVVASRRSDFVPGATWATEYYIPVTTRQPVPVATVKATGQSLGRVISSFPASYYQVWGWTEAASVISPSTSTAQVDAMCAADKREAEELIVQALALGANSGITPEIAANNVKLWANQRAAVRGCPKPYPEATGSIVTEDLPDGLLLPPISASDPGNESGLGGEIPPAPSEPSRPSPPTIGNPPGAPGTPGFGGKKPSLPGPDLIDGVPPSPEAPLAEKTPGNAQGLPEVSITASPVDYRWLYALAAVVVVIAVLSRKKG